MDSHAGFSTAPHHSIITHSTSAQPDGPELAGTAEHAPALCRLTPAERGDHRLTLHRAFATPMVRRGAVCRTGDPPARSELAMAAAALGRRLTPFDTAVLSHCSREEAAAFWGTTTRPHLPPQHPPPTERAPPLPPSPQLQVAGILEHKRPGWRGLLGSSLAAALFLCLVLWSGRSYLPPVSRLAAQQPTARRQLPWHSSTPIPFEIGAHWLPTHTRIGPVCTLAAAGQPWQQRSGQ